VSVAARRGTENFPAEWARLEQATNDAVTLLGRWIQRARQAEAEVDRLRGSLEGLATTEGTASEDLSQELRRLKAENAALRSRMLQARQRVDGLMQRLSALGVEP
jgi:phage shock protein A